MYTLPMDDSQKKISDYLYRPVPMTSTDWLVDIVIAAGAFGLGLLQMTLSANLLVPDDFIRRILGVQAVTPNAAAIVSTLLISLPLIVRRRLPWVVFAVTLIFWALYEWMDNGGSLSTISPLIALFTVAYERGRNEAIGASCAMLVVMLIPAAEGRSSGLNSMLVFQNAASVIAVGFAGYALNARQQLVEVAEARAAAAEQLRESETERAEAAERLRALEARRAAEAERTRETEASRRVEEERVRIAREVHDITAHSLSAVSIQAAAAERLIDSDPAAAKTAIEEVRATAKSALGEMRSMVGVLRGNEEAETQPTEGTEQIRSLVKYLEDAGISCEVDEGGYDRTAIPLYVDVALFGIMREACTNVVRHAGAKHVRIVLASDGSAIHLAVCDDGKGMDTVDDGSSSPASTGGHGIEGMRERVKLLDGDFAIESADGGGTCIEVAIPRTRKEAS